MSCIITPLVTNPQGQEVPSKLFSDLKDILGSDRQRIIDIYKAATDSEWLETVSEDAKFDENGEITLHSLSKLAELDFSKEAMLKKLNHDIGSGSYFYVEGLQKARKFNKSEYGEDYLATLTKDGDSYKLEVVLNTSENKLKFEKVISNHEKINIIIDTLQEQGVAVDFIDNSDIYDGKYSTENADATLDGMLHLISVVRGKTEVPSFIEEASHFAIASLNNTKQVQRLLELCQDEDFVRESGIYSDDEFELGVESPYETAGRILANVYKGESAGAYTIFMDKIRKTIASVYSKIKPESITAKRLEAERLAAEIADDFINGKGSVDTALQTPMTLFSISDSSQAARALSQTKKHLKRLKGKIRNISTNLYRDFSEIPAIKQASVTSVLTTDMLGVSHIMAEVLHASLESLVLTVENLEELKSHLPDPNKFDMSVFDTPIPDAAHTVMVLIKEIRDMITSFKNLKLNGIPEFVELTEALSSDDVAELAALEDRMHYEVFTPIASLEMQKAYGRDAILIEGKKDWSKIFFHNGKIIDIKELSKSSRESITTNELVHNVYGTDGFLGRLFNHALKLGDMGYSGLNKLFRDMDARINKTLVSDWQGKMTLLETLAKKAGYKNDFSDFLEKDDSGQITGNFISQYKVWLYYDKRKKIIDQIKARCNQYFLDHPDAFPTDYQKYQYTQEQITNDADLIMFDDESWITEPTGEKHLNPNFAGGVYVNYEYSALVSDPTKAELLEALQEYKNQVDINLLVDSDGYQHGNPYRIPQISLKRPIFDFKMNHNKDALTAMGADFALGSDLIAEETEVYLNGSDRYADAYKSLPLYGIKKIDNPSTNLITTLKLYTTMAVRYHTISSSFSELAIAGAVLSSSQRAASIIEGDSNQFTREQADIRESLDKAIFSFDVGKTSTKHKISKRVKNIAFTAFMLKTLWLNIPSMMVNGASAFTMWLKNAIASNNYNSATFIYQYLKSLITNHRRIPLLNRIGKHSKNIMYYINGLQGRHTLWSDLKKSPWIKSLCYEMPMIAYGKGDEIAQQAIYMTVLECQKAYVVPDSLYLNIQSLADFENLNKKRSTKVKRTNLLNIFADSTEDSEGQKVNNTYLKNGFLKNKEDAFKYIAMKYFLDKIESAIEENTRAEESGDPSAIFIDLNDVLQSESNRGDFIAALEDAGIEFSNSITYRSLENVKKDIKNAINEMTFTDKDIAQIIDRTTAESTEVQGLYYAGAKARISEMAEFEGMAIFMGYVLGAYNKNLNSNVNALTGEFEPGKFETAVYSYLRWITGFTSNGVFDEEDGKYRRMKALEWLAVLSLNLPILHNIAKIPSVNDTLIKLGYTEKQIQRMHMFGGDLLWMYLMSIIAGLFAPRKIDASKETLSAGAATQESAKYNEERDDTFKDIEELDWPWWKKLLKNGGLNSHIIYDMIVQPNINPDAVREGINNRFGKKSNVASILNSQDDVIHFTNNVSNMLYDLSDKLSDGSITDPMQIIEELGAVYGISATDSRDIVDYMDGYHKDGGAITKMSYNEYLHKYNLEDTTNNREDYQYFIDKNDKLIKKTFDMSNPQDVKILADNIKALTFKGYEYNKDSKEYIIAGALRYLIGRVDLEMQSNSNLVTNIMDFKTLNLFGTPLMEGVSSVSSLINDIDNLNNDNSKAIFRKMFVDFFLHKVFMESDAYGRLKTSNPDELDSAHVEKATGAKWRDGFKVYDSYVNFQKLKQ